MTVKPKDHSDWTGAYYQYMADGTALMFPSETLVRLFKGNYVPNMPKDYTGMKALEVGFGSGNNLALLASLGMELHGTEISEDICKMMEGLMHKRGIKADLRVGYNSSLPYKDNTFDYLISWNVLHYESTEEGMKAAIKEHGRVLKPGGRFFISTTGPTHNILEGAKTLGHHRYEIGRDDDFRKGAVFFYFDAENYIRHYFDPVFDQVMTGRIQDRLFTSTLDWYLITGVAR